jgi:hypothetical protein
MAGADPSLIQSIELNVPVLLVASNVCLCTAFLFALLPMKKEPNRLADSLRPGDRGSTGRRSWSSSALISTEIAIAIVVLFLGTLLIRSFQKLIRVDPGFGTDHLFSLEITLPQPRYQDQTPATNHFYERLIDKLKQSPGIVSAGTTIALPFKASHAMTRFLVAGEPALAQGALPTEQVRVVSPEFFQTMGLQLKQGSGCERKDVENSSDLIIVNQAFARRYLSGAAGCCFLHGHRVLAGLIAAFAGAHLASALLFQTSSADPVSICVSVSALLIIAMLAAVFPASRVASINPVEALRSE